MTNFHDLPRELRDKVYRYCFLLDTPVRVEWSWQGEFNKDDPRRKEYSEIDKHKAAQLEKYVDKAPTEDASVESSDSATEESIGESTSGSASSDDEDYEDYYNYPGPINFRAEQDPWLHFRIINENTSSQLLTTCKQFYHECLPILYGENRFDAHNTAAVQYLSSKIGAYAASFIKTLSVNTTDKIYRHCTLTFHPFASLKSLSLVVRLYPGEMRAPKEIPSDPVLGQEVPIAWKHYLPRLSRALISQADRIDLFVDLVFSIDLPEPFLHWEGKGVKVLNGPNSQIYQKFVRTDRYRVVPTPVTIDTNSGVVVKSYSLVCVGDFKGLQLLGLLPGQVVVG